MTLAQTCMTVGSHVVTANVKGLIRVKIETQNTEHDTENFVNFIP